MLYDCKHLSYISAITLTSYLLSVVPVITGEPTVNKGDTLDLYCNVSQSNPPASSVQWLSPGGEVVSDGEPLEIASISTRRGGLYTCVTSYNNSTVTVNNSVDVTVLCKSLCSCAMISDSCAYFCLVPGFFPHTHTHTHTYTHTHTHTHTQCRVQLLFKAGLVLHGIRRATPTSHPADYTANCAARC